jgi:hypothetical protein
VISPVGAGCSFTEASSPENFGLPFEYVTKPYSNAPRGAGVFLPLLSIGVE